MSAITNVWRQLVQRRLWPVAILLIAGLAAVPMLLAKEPEPTASAPAPAPAAADDGALTAEPIVSAAVASGNPEKHKVLGRAKNPFGLPKKATDASAAAPDSKGSVVTRTRTSDDDAPSSGSDGGSPSSGGGSSAPSTPAEPAAPAPAPKTYAPEELTVRFGSDETTKRQSLEKLQPLPSAETPLLIYMGLLKDGKTAVFMVDTGVAAVGDGDCRPSPEECETVRLTAGETEFFDVKDESGNVTDQFQLDLLKVHKGRAASATRSRASVKAAVRVLRGGSGLRSTAGRRVARLP